MAYVAVFDNQMDGAAIPIMTTSHPEIVEVIQRLISRELYRAAYITERQPRKRRTPRAKKQ